MAISRIQVASGDSFVSGVESVFGVPTTSGNFLIAVVSGQGNGTITAPASWQLAIRNSNIAVYYYENAPSINSTITFNWASSLSTLLTMAEYSGIATLLSIDEIASDTNTLNVGSTGTTLATRENSELCVGGIVAVAPATWSSPSNSFNILTQVSTPTTALCLLERIVNAVGTYGCTVNSSITALNYGVIATFGESPLSSSSSSSSFSSSSTSHSSSSFSSSSSSRSSSSLSSSSPSGASNFNIFYVNDIYDGDPNPPDLLLTYSEEKLYKYYDPLVRLTKSNWFADKLNISSMSFSSSSSSRSSSSNSSSSSSRSSSSFSSSSSSFSSSSASSSSANFTITTNCITCNPSPQNWSFTVSGINNGSCLGCVGYNASFSIPNVGGCQWLSSEVDSTCSMSDERYMLNYNSGNSSWELQLGAGLIGLYRLAGSSWNCMSCNTLNKVYENGYCVNLPTTITICPA